MNDTINETVEQTVPDKEGTVLPREYSLFSNWPKADEHKAKEEEQAKVM